MLRPAMPGEIRATDRLLFKKSLIDPQYVTEHLQDLVSAP